MDSQTTRFHLGIVLAYIDSETAKEVQKLQEENPDLSTTKAIMQVASQMDFHQLWGSYSLKECNERVKTVLNDNERLEITLDREFLQQVWQEVVNFALVIWLGGEPERLIVERYMKGASDIPWVILVWQTLLQLERNQKNCLWTYFISRGDPIFK